MPYQIANPDLSNNPAYLEPRISNLEGQLNNYKENDKASQLLQHGANIVNANVSSPLSVEVQGRTLMNLLGQSTLDTSKYYLFSPNKNTTKITVNGTTTETVTKIDGSTLAGGSVTSNFVGKVTASFVENPNYGRRTWSGSTLTTLMLPTGNGADYGEVEQARYDDWKVLNDGKRGGTSTSAVGSIAQNQFSFDIIKALENAFGTEIWQGKTLLADKIAIAKQNIASYSFNWHGYGTSVGGNKASIQRWAANTSSWFGAVSHTSGTVTRLNTGTSNLNEIDSNGFVHCIAYSEPADSVTMSAIYTDYVELVIVTSYIKPVKYTIKQDFQRKVAGSTVDNGHDFKQGQGQASLLAPNGSWAAPTQTSIDRLKSLDGQTSTAGGTSTSGGIAQQLFSFDIIRALQDKYGNQIWQGKTLLADKITIARNIITKISCNWWGYGSSAGGNKASLSVWSVNSSSWSNTFPSHTNGSITKLTRYHSTDMSAVIDTNGFTYFIAYADASDGTTSSTITTDYIELEVTVNSNLPILEDSLYEVTKAHYDLINIDPAWSGQSLVDKYPYVQGIQYLNPIVSVDGENLLPPFTEWVFTATSEYTINSPYSATLMPTVDYRTLWKSFNVLPNTTYTLDFPKPLTAGYFFDIYAVNADGSLTTLFNTVTTTKTFTTNATTTKVRIDYKNGVGIRTSSTISNIMFNAGSVAKPFVPNNPSYLCTNVVLAGVQGTNDILYKDAENWKVLRKWERDIQLDPTKYTVGFFQTYTGYKRFGLNVAPSIPADYLTVGDNRFAVSKYDGKILTNNVYYTDKDQCSLQTSANGGVKITVSNADSGFAESYTPVNDEINAYFNGWQVKTADGTGKPTAWKSIVDGTDAPTQTLAYVKVNKAANYTPYKLTYLLGTPKIEIVQVEGEMAVDGLTQVTVDSGVVVREKIIPVKNSESGVPYYEINRMGLPASFTKKKLSKFISVYKNGVLDNKWVFNTTFNTVDNGLFKAIIPEADFDTTAEYTVTYQVLEKEKFTTNAIDLKVLYNQSVRSTIDDIVAKQSDNSSIISIHDSAIAEMYKRLKALGG